MAIELPGMPSIPIVNPLPDLLGKLATVGKIPAVEGVAKLLTIKFGEAVSLNPPHVGPAPSAAAPPPLAPLPVEADR